MWCGGICRETGRFCPYATVNRYCSLTACINHPSIITIPYEWVIEKDVPW